MRLTNETPQQVPSVRVRPRAVIACTDCEICQILAGVVREFGLQPVCLERFDDLNNRLGQQETVIVFIQARFAKSGFRDILNAAERPGFRIPVIVCSEFYDRDVYMEAMTQGAFDYLATPYRHDQVAWVVNNAVHRGPLPPRAHAA